MTRRPPAPRFNLAEPGNAAAIVMDPVFAGLAPGPNREEMAHLHERLVLEGCREPLIIWPQAAVGSRPARQVLVTGYDVFPLLREPPAPLPGGQG